MKKISISGVIIMAIGLILSIIGHYINSVVLTIGLILFGSGLCIGVIFGKIYYDKQDAIQRKPNPPTP